MKYFTLVKLCLLSLILGSIFYSIFLSYGIFIVVSSSMSPNLPKNSIVVVDKRVKHLTVGDVITFWNSNKVRITHRIVKKLTGNEEAYYLTKGDNMESIDKDKVSRNLIIGRVVFTFPYLGYIIFSLTHPLFLLFFFYIPVGHYFGTLCKRFVNQISN